LLFLGINHSLNSGDDEFIFLSIIPRTHDPLAILPIFEQMHSAKAINKSISCKKRGERKKMYGFGFPLMNLLSTGGIVREDDMYAAYSDAITDEMEQHFPDLTGIPYSYECRDLLDNKFGKGYTRNLLKRVSEGSQLRGRKAMKFMKDLITSCDESLTPEFKEWFIPRNSKRTQYYTPPKGLSDECFDLIGLEVLYPRVLPLDTAEYMIEAGRIYEWIYDDE